MLSTLLLLTALAYLGLGRPCQHCAKNNTVWNIDNLHSLITFGDSHTDENRLRYFITHNGSAPAAGTFLPESFETFSGGRVWPRHVVQYTGQTVNNDRDAKLILYDYAVAGAACSNNITPQSITISPYTLSTLKLPILHLHTRADDRDHHRNRTFTFPSVLEYEVPAFQADLHSIRNGTTDPSFTPALTATNAVDALWIGTTDLGYSAFLTDAQVPGTTLASYTDCIYTVFDRLYATGARRFVLMNTIPLELAPLYANATLNGTIGLTSEFWPDKPDNRTAIAETTREYTTAVNEVFRHHTPFEAVIANRYPGAEWALFDVHQLMIDVYTGPAEHFNGTEQVTVTVSEYQCHGDVCANAYNGTSPDSLVWRDVLHRGMLARQSAYNEDVA